MMANLQHLRKVGAHSNQETRPCESSSPRPTVAPDSQPSPTKRKRKHATLSSWRKNTRFDKSNYSEPQFKRQKTLSRSSSSSSTSSSCSSGERAKRDYWDSLSRLWLTPSALRELNRRNALLRASAAPTADTPVKLKQCPTGITHFARHGGPDLSDIRKYPDPEGVSSTPTTMTSRGSGRGKRSSAYDGDFEQHLMDNYVMPPDRDHEPANYQDWKEVLIQPRASLSPSRRSDSSYKSFVRAVGKVKGEDEVMSNVFPRLRGEDRPPSGQNVEFRHIAALTPKIVVAKPDYYEGSRPGPGNRTIRERLDKSIIPSPRKELPFLPTFFTEAKGPRGAIDVAERQVCHDGALGARAMHSVQALGRSREEYGNKAHTASAILHGRGSLEMYTHHMTQPRGQGSPAHVHTTPLGSWGLGHSPQSFREGRTAFKNVSDKAHQHREHAIQGANRRLGIITPEESQIAPTSSRRRLSRFGPVSESNDSGTESSSESGEEGNSDDDYRGSSRLRPEGKLLKPKIISASPQRLAKRTASPRPMNRRRKAMVSSDSDPGSSSEEDPSKPARRPLLSKPEVITATPKRPAKRQSSPPRRELRPRRGARRS